jgi:PPK2 family polyphosphate:nucleotide phosphotransferase
MLEKFIVPEGKTIDLSTVEPGYTGPLDRKELKSRARENIKEMQLWQQKLYAEGKQSLLVVLQALDAGGKDGTIRKVFGWINPQGCRVTSFKAPTKKELSHDFLWRIHEHAPAKGMISIFNRSHYEDVLIVKVHDWINDSECSMRYDDINAFEHLLYRSGTRILKFFLYISKDEQKARFQERLDIPEKNWKFARGDLEERKLWDKYMLQFQDVFKHTSKVHAPWFIIPASNKRYRNFVISSIVRETLEDMSPSFPPPEKGLDTITID